MTDLPSRVEILGSKTVYSGFFQMVVHILRHERYDGSMSPNITREIFERGNAVAVLPYDPISDSVVMIRQFLPGAHLAGLPAWPPQIVAGMVEEGETVEDVARREAGEEANIVVTDLKKIATYLPSPGGSTETITVFCALIDASGAGGIHGLAEEHEDIRVEVVPAQEAIRMLDEGEVTPSTAVVALHWLARNRDSLRPTPPQASEEGSRQFITDDGVVDVAYFDGYAIRERLLENVMIECRFNKAGKIICAFQPKDEKYVSSYNAPKLLKEAEEYANSCLEFVTASGDDAWLEA